MIQLGWLEKPGERYRIGNRLFAHPLRMVRGAIVHGSNFKRLAFSGVGEIEDIFDAVLEWIAQPGVEELVRRRQATLTAERDDET